MRNAERGKEGRVLNAEFGMRPPAHRGLRLRPGGNAERITEDRGKKTEVRGQKTDSRSKKAGSMGPEVALGGKSSGRVVLTGKGRLMAGIPLDPRLSRMLIEAKKEGCIDEMTIIVAALSIQNPRERPVEKAQEADRLHATFHDPQSDFVTLLNIWHRYESHRQKVKSNNRMKRFCREHFLSYMRMREWGDIHHQISLLLKEHGIRPPAHRGLRLRPGGNAEGGLRPIGACAYAPVGMEKAEKGRRKQNWGLI